MSNYRYTTYAQRSDLLGEARQLNGSVWPEFMFHDAVADRLWNRLEGTFADSQTIWLDASDHVVAVGNTVPLVWDGAIDHGMTPSSARWPTTMQAARRRRCAQFRPQSIDRCKGRA
jgi:hypothetical protein